MPLGAGSSRRGARPALTVTTARRVVPDRAGDAACAAAAHPAIAKALIAFAIAAVVCFILEPHILNFLKQPYCSLVLFAAGGFLAYLTLPTGLKLLLGFSGDGLVSILDAEKYLSYITTMLLIFGLSFEVPLLVCMLNLAGVVSTAKLQSWRRPEIFLVFVFAAIVTPSQDPSTMLALGIPMCLLYEVVLLIGWANDRRAARRAATSPYAGLADVETSPLDLDDLESSRSRRAVRRVRSSPVGLTPAD